MSKVTGILTLTDFLLARLDEDESAARAAIESWDSEDDGAAFGELSSQSHAFVRRYDPARALLEIASKRRLIEDDRDGYPDDSRSRTLRALASPYSDHSAYRAEWSA